MTADVRMTHATALVLQALARGHGYGFDVMDATGLPGGTVYPALRRLEAAGLVISEWEEARRARQAGRPSRKYYRLTDDGEEALEAALRRYRVLALVEESGPAGAGS